MNAIDLQVEGETPRDPAPRVLLLEPFYDGSHRAFVEVLTETVPAEWTVWTMPGRHWKWRMRGSAVHFAERFEAEGAPSFDLVLATSYVSLAELFGLAPALARVPSLLYFHENQLTYPVRQKRTWDHHFGRDSRYKGTLGRAAGASGALGPAA